MRSVLTQGLYDPANEHDACGFGFLANIDGRKTHAIVQRGITALERLIHRGACGCDPETGDGAGLLLQIPHALFADEAERLGFELPTPGAYGVAMMFMPHAKDDRAACRQALERYVQAEGQKLLGWRDVPQDSAALGWLAREGEPVVEQAFVARQGDLDTDAFERKLLVIRKQVEHAIAASDLEEKEQFYIASLSARTIVYKGLIMAYNIEKYYADLADERFVTALALIHQRYSTNTLPVPIYLPQRRDQHPARQPQQHAVSRTPPRQPAFRRRYQKAGADSHAGGERQCEFR